MNKRALLTACGVGFAFSANYTNHAPMADVLRDRFALTQAGTGLLTTAIFCTHALMQVPEGRVVLAGSDIANGWSGFIDGAIETGITSAVRVEALLA